MAALPEIHVWRDELGRIERVEFRDGPQRMELRSVTKATFEFDAASPTPAVVLSLMAKPVYHDPSGEEQA